MTEALGYIINGFLIGGVYALVGLAIVVIYKSSGVFNFATGDFVMWGGFVTFSLLSIFQLPPWIAYPLALVLMGVIGIIINRFIISPMTGGMTGGGSLFAIVLMTIALAYLLRALQLAIWGPVTQVFPPLLPKGVIHLGEIDIAEEYLLYFIIAMIAIGIFSYFFQKTKVGLGMRATSEDTQLARATGIKVKLMFAATWVSALVLSWVAGVLLGSMNNLNPYLYTIGAKGFPVVLLGGMESIVGCIVGGVTIGVAENLGAGYLNQFTGGGIQEVIPFVVMVIILIFKPSGIFGQKKIERV